MALRPFAARFSCRYAIENKTGLTQHAADRYTGGVSQDRGPETTLLTWNHHRLREAPGRIGLAALGYGTAFLLWRWLLPHPLALFLPVVALTSALAEYLFPVEYRLTDRGAYQSCGPFQKLFLSWDDVKRASFGTDGVYLSPLSRPSRLDRFRGIALRCGDSSKEQVLQTVREHWKRRETAP